MDFVPSLTSAWLCFASCLWMGADDKNNAVQRPIRLHKCRIYTRRSKCPLEDCRSLGRFSCLEYADGAAARDGTSAYREIRDTLDRPTSGHQSLHEVASKLVWFGRIVRKALDGQFTIRNLTKNPHHRR
jgi:hypothetical protein